MSQRFSNTDGTWLALAAAAGLAAASSKRGSRSTELERAQQQRVYHILRSKGSVEDVEEYLKDLGNEYVDRFTPGYSRYAVDYIDLNIKAHDAFWGAPDWVKELMGYMGAKQVVQWDAEFQIDELIRRIGDRDDELYQPWWNGKWEIRGRQGGYIRLHASDGENSPVGEWFLRNDLEDVFSPTIAGLRIRKQEGEDLFDAIIQTEDAIAAIDRLTEYVDESVKGFNQHWSSEQAWEQHAEANYSEETIAEAKAAVQDPQWRARP